MGSTVEGFAAMSAGTSGAVARLSVTTSFLLHWSDIAIERAAAARRARSEEEASRASGRPSTDALQRELHASMVAIVAAALAIDALYGAVRDDAGVPAETRERWRANETARWKRILETLKHGFRVGPDAHGWSAELRWLFDLRDRAAHFEERVREPVERPLGGYPAVERVEYAVESADRAVDLLLSILSACALRPKPGTAAWAGRMAATVHRIVGSRSAPARGG